MNNKQKITTKFTSLQSKIDQHIMEYKFYIPHETEDFLIEVALELDEVMKLIADIKEEKEWDQLNLEPLDIQMEF